MHANFKQRVAQLRCVLQCLREAAGRSDSVRAVSKTANQHKCVLGVRVAAFVRCGSGGLRFKFVHENWKRRHSEVCVCCVGDIEERMVGFGGVVNYAVLCVYLLWMLEKLENGETMMINK